MQSARIWFQQTNPPITLSTVGQHLISLGAQFEETSWTFETFVVPQLYVVEPVPFLLQLTDHEYVHEEAKESSQDSSLPDVLRDKLGSCDVRLEIGDVSANTVISEREVTAFEGWTEFDPGRPKAQKLLRLLANTLDGIFEDNVNGQWWST